MISRRRKEAAEEIHYVGDRILKQMISDKRAKLTVADKKYLTNTLKRFKTEHSSDLGKQQEQILERLLLKAKDAKTSLDLLKIHQATCALGLKKI